MSYFKKNSPKKPTLRVQTDIAIFIRQLATLVSSGIPLLRSLNILFHTHEKMQLHRLISHLQLDLINGLNFFTSIKKHTTYFDTLTCHMIKMGEQMGQLDKVLLAIAVKLENHLAFKKQLYQALFYPCLLVCIALAISACMFVFVIPRFAELFLSAQIPLPFITRLLFKFSNLISNPWILSFLFILVILGYYGLQIIFSRANLTLFIFQLHPIRFFLKKLTLARFARNLAMTFSAGLPIHSAIRLSGYSSTKDEFGTIVQRLYEKIQSGLSLHVCMANIDYFPKMMVQMIKIGEESGQLELMLNKTADFLEADIQQSLAHLNKLLEPLIMLILGVLIGGLVIGMYLPLFKLGSAF